MVDKATPSIAKVGPISSLSSQIAASSQHVSFRSCMEYDTDRKDGSDKKQKNHVPTVGGDPLITGGLSAPFTPRRLSLSNRLSLQMPSRGPLPLSPVLDPVLGYSVARRPRLDFARACTSLHHSTLAESSPDSPPLASSTGYPIPRNGYIKPLDSPITQTCHQGSSHAASISSTSMLDYAPSADDLDSSTEDEDIDIEIDTVFPSAAVSSQTDSPASLSLREYRKARLGHRSWRRRQHVHGNGFFVARSPTLRASQTNQGIHIARIDHPVHRESISLGPSALDSGADPARPDPIRRPVSRRGSLLPKTKNFVRIKAALIEESSPIDVEVKREAQITRQIREEEGSPSPNPVQCTHSTEYELGEIYNEECIFSNSNSFLGNGGMGIRLSKHAPKIGGFWFGDQMDTISGSPPSFPSTKFGQDGDVVMNSDSTVNSPILGISADIRRVKRRRAQDEILEPSVFKRRAVSPGLSNSPILTQSSPSGSTGGSRRLNYQGLSDTNEGLMKMSLQ